MDVRLLFAIILLLGLSGQTAVSAQDTSGPESTPAQQVQSQKKKGYFKTAWRLPYPNPYRAGIYSLVIPGTGQLYNKRYWKAPIVWGGFAALVYAVDYNKMWRNRFETAYGLGLIGMEHEFTGVIRDNETLRRYRNSYDKNLQLSYVGFFGMYLLNALDAYVDAHLKAFDIDDDLSLSVRPVFNGTHQSGIGLGIFLTPGIQR